MAYISCISVFPQARLLVYGCDWLTRGLVPDGAVINSTGHRDTADIRVRTNTGISETVCSCTSERNRLTCDAASVGHLHGEHRVTLRRRDRGACAPHPPLRPRYPRPSHPGALTAPHAA
ncbi:hypothetical protein RR46_01562 [Papilio xuthus]|uniref:Uncharacterized protein n=1 Tax=Papilio xuthus TaxID=66420 RepID=A0A0N1PEZ0_PAPXU|nr:hypothetical protein RR46_01562 [Papilio xuthus]